MKFKGGAIALSALITFQTIPAAWAAAEETKPEAKGQEESAVLTNETRVYLGACLFVDPKLPKDPNPPKDPKDKKSDRLTIKMIDPGIAIAAGKFLIDATAAMIKVASEEERVNTISAFPASGWFYDVDGQLVISMNPEYQCLQVVTGRFKTKFEKSLYSKISRNASLEELKSGITAQRPEVDAPRVFFEARIEPFKSTPTSQPDVFRLAPNAFFFTEPTESRFGDRFRDEVKRSIAISINFARANGAQASFGSFVIPFPQIAKGTYLTPDYFTSLATKPIPIPAVTVEEKENYASIKTALAAAVLKEKTKVPTAPAKLVPLATSDETYKQKRELYCAENRKLGEAKHDAICSYPMNDYKAEMDRARENQLALFAFQNQQENVLAATDIKCVDKVCSANPYFMLPFTASAVIVELSEPGKFAKFMNDFAVALAPSAKTALETSINKQNIDPKIASDADASKNDDYLVQVAKVKLAQEDLAAGGDETAIKEKKETLLTAMKEANSKARAAGLTAPYDLSNPY